MGELNIEDHFPQFFLIPDFFSNSPPSKYNKITGKTLTTKNF